MNYIDNIAFAILLIIGIGFFAKNVKTLIRNIKLGHDVSISDNKSRRWKNMAMIALGQSKMVARPLAGFMHILIYVGFVLINIEILEIIIDGVFGTHRLFYGLIGSDLYYALIGSFELLAFLVLVACVVFLIRRNIGKLKRFSGTEMTKWPKNDGNFILYFEMILTNA